MAPRGRRVFTGKPYRPPKDLEPLLRHFLANVTLGELAEAARKALRASC